ncbi:Probable flavin-containing monooxygenase 1 [Linum grandiflorum]
MSTSTPRSWRSSVYVGCQTTASAEYGDLLPGHPVWDSGRSQSDSMTPNPYRNGLKEFEMVVVCTGKSGDVAKIPEFQKKRGPEVFKGKVMHCTLNKDESRELMKGKNVAIIGFQESALDLAVECAERQEEVIRILMVHK